MVVAECASGEATVLLVDVAVEREGRQVGPNGRAQFMGSDPALGIASQLACSRFVCCVLRGLRLRLVAALCGTTCGHRGYVRWQRGWCGADSAVKVVLAVDAAVQTNTI